MARIIDTNKLASPWFTALTPVLAFTGSDATEHPPPLFFLCKDASMFVPETGTVQPLTEDVNVARMNSNHIWLEEYNPIVDKYRYHGARSWQRTFFSVLS